MREAVQPLISLLEDSDRWVRLCAILALGELGDQAAVEPLIPILADEDVWVSVEAVIALGKLHATSTIPTLAQMESTLKEQLQIEGQLSGEKTGLHKALIETISSLQEHDKETEPDTA
jgi:HEAT repeat protein